MKALELYDKILKEIKPFKGVHVSDENVNDYILRGIEDLISWVGKGTKDYWITSGDVFVMVQKSNSDHQTHYTVRVCRIEKDCLYFQEEEE